MPAGFPVLHIKSGGELKVAGGTAVILSIDDGLIMDSGGRITGDTPSGTGAGASITINVKLGNVLLQTGAFITADNTKGMGCGSGIGGTINLTAAGQNATITTEDDSIISASGLSAARTLGTPNPPLGTCSAGAINIAATDQGTIDIKGDVLSESGRPGSGNASNAPKGGGPISIEGDCYLTVSSTGKVSSLGRDPGADLVHLKANCAVLIEGLVQSTGVGHVVSRNGGISSTLCTSSYHADKPANATACVEVWAGDSLIINQVGAKGEVNADTGHSPGGSSGTSWIDLFAKGEIQVLSGTNAAVHANGNAGTNDNGGVIQVKTDGTGGFGTLGRIVLNGLALQANATGAGGAGGTVDVEAALDVKLTAIDGSHVDGIVEAKGASGGGGGQHGGHIIVASQKDILAAVASVLNVAGRNPADGVVDLLGCPASTIQFPFGTVLPATIFPTISQAACPTPVVFEAYVKLAATCPCLEACIPARGQD